jgi:hypothetical protein
MVMPGIEPRTSGSVAKNSDHYTTEAVLERFKKEQESAQKVKYKNRR